jgi:hypothetical protein
MSDRQLLKDAAKAAGYKVHGDCGDGALWVHPEGAELDHYGELPIVKFNPLTDDGDALRLAVKLRMEVDAWGAGASAVVTVNNRALVAEPHYGDDPERATRRAIVRAAAEIGKDQA